MGQGSNRIDNASSDVNFPDERFIAPSDEEFGSDGDDASAKSDAEIQQTREEIGETLDAISAKLQPERLTEDAKNLAQDTVDHLLEEGKSTAEDVSEIASIAAMEAVDYATKKAQELLPDLRKQAQDAANEAVDHAVAEAKAAVQEISEQMHAALRAATIGRIENMAHTTSEKSKYIGSSTVEKVKQNPGPAALAALGLSWLFMGGKGSGTQTLTQTNQSSGGSLSQGISDMAGHVQDKAGTVTDQVQSGLDTATEQVQETVEQTSTNMQQAMSGAAGQVQQAAGQVVEEAQQVPSKTRRMVEENPVPLGLVAIALGSAAALLIPETRKEHQVMGEARDALVETAKSKSHDAAEKAQDIIEGMQTTVENIEEVVQKETK